MIRYEFRKPEGDTLRQLNELTGNWIKEDCSFGIVMTESDDWGELLLTALDGDRIVGFAYGGYYIKEKKTSYMDAGTRCFEVEGLYVLPEYRSMRIGKALYTRLEETVKSNCAYITLATSTKDYQRILKFYVEDLGMTFHSAFLFKSLEEPQCE